MPITIVSSGNCGLTWTSTVSNPTISVSYQTGDYIIVNQMSNGGASTPTGFTNVYNNGTSGLQLSYYKFTTSGSSYQIPIPAYNGSITWMVIRGANSVKQTGAAVSNTSISVTPSGNYAIVTTTGNSSSTEYRGPGYTVVPSASWPSTDYYTLAFKTFTGTSILIPNHSTWTHTDNYILFEEYAVPDPPGTVTFNPTSTAGQTGTIQTWTVPSSGTYTIKAWGAAGGRANQYNPNYPGRGAYVETNIALTAGEVLKILVGQMGQDAYYGGGGGGGTFVIRGTNTPLVVAGGGGGAYSNGDYRVNNSDASATTGGRTASGGTATNGGAGGGGLLADGQNGYSPSTGGKAFVNGGNGGNTAYSPYAGNGGFGGGGGGEWNYYGSSGGGGGYSGGSSGTSGNGGYAGANAGGGGGSYAAGTGTIISAGARDQLPGLVKILPPPNAAPAAPTIVTPKSTGSTFNPRPKIIVNVPTDADGNTVQIRAVLKNSGGTTLQTLTSSFVTQGTGTVTLTPTADLPAGTITIVLDATDNTVYSSANTYTFVIAATPAFSVQAADVGITKANIDNLETWINNARLFRGLTSSDFIEAVTASDTAIKKTHLDTCRTQITAVLSIVGITPTWTDPTIVAGDTVRKGTHWIEIFNYLKQC